MTDPITIDYGKAAAGNRIFLAFTLLATIGCVSMAVVSRAEESGSSFLLASVGLLWFALSGMVWLASVDPVRLVAGRFDEQARRFVLTSADGATCILPYREFASFGMRREVSKGKHSRVWYVVHLLKRDGGLWDLQSFGDPGLAQELLRGLEAVDLAAAQADEVDTTCPLPNLFQREDVDGVSRFTWKNQARFLDSLFGVLFGSGLVLMLFAIPGIMTGAATFFQLLGGSVALYIAYRVYKSRGRAYQLEISDRFLTYSTRERGAAGFQAKQVLSVEQVTRLQSSYDLNRSDQEREHQLRFLGQDPESIELELPGIRTSDVLAFEAHLQAELARRGHTVA